MCVLNMMPGTNFWWWPPLIAWEHCVVNDPETAIYNFDSVGSFLITQSSYNRAADTTLKLQTGGKGVSKKMNLWQISGSAEEILYKRSVPSQREDGSIYMTGPTLDEQIAPTSPIPAPSVTIDGMPLGNDGIRWRLYADNDTRDVTPRVQNKDFYTFTVNAQKYKLYVEANTSPLQPGHVVQSANFCVGQSLGFSPLWRPSTPPYVDAVAAWSLPRKFVNDQPYWYCDAYYDENASLLDKILSRDGTLSTFCWYVLGLNAGSASVSTVLFFPNGETVAVSASGQFNVYRPTLPGWSAWTPTPNLAIWGNQLNVGPQNYGVGYTCNINSANISGQAAITQVFDDFSSPASENWGTGVLDTSETYPGTSRTILANPSALSRNNIAFSDQPGNGLVGNSTSLILNFRDYIRFEPTSLAGPEPNIFVTLGRVTWNVEDAWANLVGGAWQVTSGSVTMPSLDASSVEFPYWTSAH